MGAAPKPFRAAAGVAGRSRVIAMVGFEPAPLAIVLWAPSIELESSIGEMLGAQAAARTPHVLRLVVV